MPPSLRSTRDLHAAPVPKKLGSLTGYNKIPRSPPLSEGARALLNLESYMKPPGKRGPVAQRLVLHWLPNPPEGNDPHRQRRPQMVTIWGAPSIQAHCTCSRVIRGEMWFMLCLVWSAPGLLCIPHSESARRPNRELTTASVCQGSSRHLALALADTSSLTLTM